MNFEYGKASGHIGRLYKFIITSFDWMRGIKCHLIMRPKPVPFFYKTGAQHTEYCSKGHHRDGCVHYMKLSYKRIYIIVEVVLPKYYKQYLGFNSYYEKEGCYE